MANIRDEVNKLDECLKDIAKHCEAEGTDKHRNLCYKTLVREGIRRFTKYGYVYNGVCFVYRGKNSGII